MLLERLSLCPKTRIMMYIKAKPVSHASVTTVLLRVKEENRKNVRHLEATQKQGTRKKSEPM